MTGLKRRLAAGLLAATLLMSGFSAYASEVAMSAAAPSMAGAVPESSPAPPPEATSTPAPEATSTPAPEATPTPVPEATPTPVPEATPTPAPEATPTPAPEATSTPAPEATSTPAPEATSTPAPEATPTPVPEEDEENTYEFFAAPESNNGWGTGADNTKYYKDGVPITLKEELIDGAWYYFGADGNRAAAMAVKLEDGRVMYYGEDGKNVYAYTGPAVTADGATYYLTGEGAYRTGEIYYEGAWHYFDGSGVMVKGVAQLPDGRMFQYGTDGRLQYDFHGLVEYSGGKYYLIGGGAICKGERNIDGAWHYFDDKGRMAEEMEVKLPDGRILYYGAGGALQVGFVMVSGEMRYYDTTYGRASGERLLDGAWYYFTSNGTMVTGVTRLPDGRLFQYGKDGRLNYEQTGLVTDAAGTRYYLLGGGKYKTGEAFFDESWHYFYPDGHMAANENVKLPDGRILYYRADGSLQLGFVTEKDGIRYYDSQGMVKGEKLIDGTWYYFFSNGVMATGVTRLPDGRLFNYGKDGRIQYSYVGFAKSADGQQFYLTGAGKYFTGEWYNNGTWHYFAPDGHMAQNEAVKLPDGRTLFYGANGGVQFGWVTIAGHKYYFDSTIGMLTNRRENINGVWYTFNEQGWASVTEEKMLTVTRNGKVVTDTATNILSRVVMAEVGAFNNAEVYKAQAIATHSWILYQQAHGNPAPAVPDPSYEPTAYLIQSVGQVANMVMTYQGQPILAQYTASVGGGITNSSVDAGWSSLPYLVRVPSIYDRFSEGQLGARYMVQTVVDKTQMMAALNRIYDNDGKEPINFDTDMATWISYTPNFKNYAGQMRISIQRATSSGFSGIYTPSANYFKENSGLSLRAADYTVQYNGNGTWTFTTYGFGHGAGMSQWGAYFYAVNENMNYEQILHHYYTGVALTIC